MCGGRMRGGWRGVWAPFGGVSWVLEGIMRGNEASCTIVMY